MRSGGSNKSSGKKSSRTSKAKSSKAKSRELPRESNDLKLFNKMCEIQTTSIDVRGEIIERVEQFQNATETHTDGLERLTEQLESFENKIKSCKSKYKKKNKRLKLQQGIIERLEGQAIDLEPLHTLKKRAVNLKSTIEYVQKNFDNPNLIIKYLFGIDNAQAKAEARWCLKNIGDKTPFDGDDSKRIRSLLAKTTLFTRERVCWPEYKTPSAEENPRPRQKVGFEVEVKMCNTDTKPTKDLLEQQTDFKHLLALITKLFAQEPTSEKTFHEFVHLLLKFINAIERIDYNFSEPDPKTAAGGEIGIISYGGINRFLYEFKPHPLVPHLVTDPNNITLDYAEIQVCVERLVGYIIANYSLSGVLTDGETVVFIQLDEDRLYNIPIWEKTIPMKIRSTHINATEPSCIETMISWILSTDYNSIEFYLYEMYSRGQSPSPNKESILPTIHSGHALHQKPRFQEFLVRALEEKWLQNLQPNLQPSDEVVLKLFDPIAAAASNTSRIFNFILRDVKESYALELRVSQKLHKIQGFNNCYFEQVELWAAVQVSNRLSSGKCLIRKAVKSKPLPNTPNAYGKVKTQVQLLHRNGIVHNDLSAATVLYSKDGKVYIVGFGKAILEPKKETMDKEDQAVETMFAERSRARRKYIR